MSEIKIDPHRWNSGEEVVAFREGDECYVTYEDAEFGRFGAKDIQLWPE